MRNILILLYCLIYIPMYSQYIGGNNTIIPKDCTIDAYDIGTRQYVGGNGTLAAEFCALCHAGNIELISILPKSNKWFELRVKDYKDVVIDKWVRYSGDNYQVVNNSHSDKIKDFAPKGIYYYEVWVESEICQWIKRSLKFEVVVE